MAKLADRLHAALAGLSSECEVNSNRAPSIVVVVCLAMSSLAACGSAQSDTITVVRADKLVSGWVRFTQPAGDYTVLFDATPTHDAQNVQLPDGNNVTVFSYRTESDGKELQVISAIYPLNTVLSLADARDTVIDQMSATLVSSEEITLQGRRGLQFRAGVAHGAATYLSQMYVDGTSAFHLVAVVKGTVTFDDPQVATFFDSFEFTKDK